MCLVTLYHENSSHPSQWSLKKEPTIINGNHLYSPAFWFHDSRYLEALARRASLPSPDWSRKGLKIRWKHGRFSKHLLLLRSGNRDSGERRRRQAKDPDALDSSRKTVVQKGFGLLQVSGLFLVSIVCFGYSLVTGGNILRAHGLKSPQKNVQYVGL